MRNSGFWSPYAAGVLLGLTLLATFAFSGWGLGASSALSLLAGVGVHAISPEFADRLVYFAKYLDKESPLKDWVLFEVGGLLLGAALAAFSNRTFKLQFDKGGRIGSAARFVAAFMGGVLIGFASRLARGCTSGIALSGGAQLALSGWVFVMAMFVVGFVVAPLFRRLWT